MSDKTDPALCSLITKLCKPPQNFDFPENKNRFRFIWFEEFPWFVILGERFKHIACIVLYLVINTWENLYKKPYQS